MENSSSGRSCPHLRERNRIGFLLSRPSHSKRLWTGFPLPPPARAQQRLMEKAELGHRHSHRRTPREGRSYASRLQATVSVTQNSSQALAQAQRGRTQLKTLASILTSPWEGRIGRASQGRGHNPTPRAVNLQGRGPGRRVTDGLRNAAGLGSVQSSQTHNPTGF